MRIIAPASLGHEGIPNLDLLLRRSLAMLDDPVPSLLVGKPRFHSHDKLLVLDLQKRAAAMVKALSQILDVILTELARGMQTDLLDHTEKIDQTVNFSGDWKLASRNNPAAMQIQESATLKEGQW